MRVKEHHSSIFIQILQVNLMKIYGLQKLSLLDYPDKMAAIIFTGGCNFLCPFCHNRDLVMEINNLKEISQKELFSFLEKRKNVLEGVCITGGEPLIHSDTSIIRKIKELGYLVKLDTNGSYPERLKNLVEEKLLDYVAMDIKNSLNKYAVTSGVKEINLNKIKESVSFLLKNKVAYEFRTTVVKELHEKEDFVFISQWLMGAEKYFLQNYKNSENIIKKGYSSHKIEQLEIYKNILEKNIKFVKIR